MMRTKTLAILNCLALALHLALTFLAQRRRLAPLNVGEVSDSYETVFAPAGITFAIWGVIYVSLAGFCLYHLFKAFKSSEDDQANVDTRAIGWLFVANNIATGAWLAAWVNQALGLSLVLILIQLLTLTLISIRAHISNPHRPVFTRVFAQFPLSIYFGWICIATIANASTLLVSVNWDGFRISSAHWAIIMIGAATLLSLFIILVRRNFFFGLVILWALYGIVLKRQQTNELLYSDVIHAAWAAFIIILIAMLVRIFKRTDFRSV